MNKINYLLIMLFIYIYSPAIIGSAPARPSKPSPNLPASKTGLTKEDLKKELEDFEKMEVDEDEEDKEEKLNEDYSGGLVKTGKSISKITLSGFVKSIGKIISTSLCKDRAFTIIPNIGEDGQRALGYILLTHER